MMVASSPAPWVNMAGLRGDRHLGDDGVRRDLAGAGIQHAIFNMPNVHDTEPLVTFGREIIPAVADF